MIHKLSQETIDQPNAGEVIQNAASIVKEATENSIDAGANEINISIQRVESCQYYNY